LRENGMRADHSWTGSARAYARLYAGLSLGGSASAA